MSNDAPGAMGRITQTGSAIFDKPKDRPTEKKPPEEAKSRPESQPAAKKKTEKSQSSGQTQLIRTDLIDVWPFADRPDVELGDLQELAFSISASKQSIPALVRPKSKGRYELIYGRRRLEACKMVGADLWAICRDMTDEEAFIEQANENDKRESLSAWARSLSYQRALDKGLFKSTSALAASLGLDRSTVSNIMTFQRLPKSLVEAIGDWSRVGILTAKAIQSALSDNPKFENALIERKDDLVSGKLGPSGIRRLAIESEPRKKPSSEQVKNSAGLPVFSMGTNAKGEVTISILSGGRSILDNEAIKKGVLELFEKKRV